MVEDRAADQARNVLLNLPYPPKAQFTLPMCDCVAERTRLIGGVSMSCIQHFKLAEDWLACMLTDCW